MSKLTDAQLVILSKAAQREDREVELPAQPTARFVKALKALIERGLLEDVPSERAMPVWRHSEDENEPRALIITELGLVAIGVIAGGTQGANELAVEEDGVDSAAHAGTPKTGAAAKPRRSAPPSPVPTTDAEGISAPTARRMAKPRTGSPSATGNAPTGKTATVIKLLQRKDGASIAALIEATGWLPHSTRAALTGLRKKGYAVERDKARDKTTTIYRITAAPSGKAA